MRDDDNHSVNVSMADVPAALDMREMRNARDWAQSAQDKRPAREAFFARFESEVKALGPGVTTILELGSGPGFLAARLLQACPQLEYTLLDYSPAMHQLARERLGHLAARAHFMEMDLKELHKIDLTPRFSCVVTMQAVHELRHKRHAPQLHRSVRGLLAQGGPYLVCDPFTPAADLNESPLFMTLREQRDALLGAGFTDVELLMQKEGLALYRAA